jgi:hypothetical protein
MPKEKMKSCDAVCFEIDLSYPESVVLCATHHVPSLSHTGLILYSSLYMLYMCMRCLLFKYHILFVLLRSLVFGHGSAWLGQSLILVRRYRHDLPCMRMIHLLHEVTLSLMAGPLGYPVLHIHDTFRVEDVSTGLEVLWDVIVIKADSGRV